MNTVYEVYGKKNNEEIIKYKKEIKSLIEDSKFLINEMKEINGKIKKENEDEILKKYKIFLENINDVTDIISLINIKIPNILNYPCIEKEPLCLFNKNKKNNYVQLKEKLEKNYKIIKVKRSKLGMELYKSDYSKFQSIEKFVIRKLFIYYMLYLTELIKKDENYNDSDELKSLTHNVLEEVEKMIDDDNWILGNNQIKKYLFDKKLDIKNIDKKRLQKDEYSKGELEESKKIILDTINEVRYDVKFIVKLTINSEIKSSLENNEELIKMIDRIDEILFEFIEFYNGSEKAYEYFDELEDIKKIFNLLGYRYKNIKSCETCEVEDADKLDIKLCQTLDVVKIENEEELDKEFKICKVYRDAIVEINNNEEIIKRKALVSVYRYIIE